MSTRRLAVALACAALASAPHAARAQERLVGLRRVDVGPVFERWTFGAALPQRGGDTTVQYRIASASQLSVPITAVVPLGERWTFDLCGAYSRGTLRLDTADARGNTRYELAGLTDVKLRLAGRLRGDAVLLTLGANVPTGRTGLAGAEYQALRVLAAPALRFQTTALGGGFGATTGLVLARQVAGWAWALGASYEVRGSYSPVDAQLLGVGADELNPGDVLHLSVGSDGLVGPHRASLALSADVYGADRLTMRDATTDSTRAAGYRLGPVLTAEWQMQLAARGFRELSLYVADRYRMKFTRPDGSAAAGSSGHELDAGLLGTIPWTRALAVVVGLDGRYHTGLAVDNSVATAAFASGGGTLGLAWGAGAATLTPYVRAQAGTIDTGGFSTSALGLSGGITLGTRF